MVGVLHKALQEVLLPPKQSGGAKKELTLEDIKNGGASKLDKFVRDNASHATSLLKDVVNKAAAAVESADAPVQQARAAAEKASEALKNAAAGATEILDAVQKANDIAAKGITAAVQAHTAVSNTAASVNRLSDRFNRLLALAREVLTLVKAESAQGDAEDGNKKFANIKETSKEVLGDVYAIVLGAVIAAGDAAIAADAVVTAATAAAPDAAAAVEAATAAKAAARDALTQVKEKLGISGQETVARTPQGEHDDAPDVDGSHESHTSPPDATDPALLVPTAAAALNINNADGGSSSAWVRAPILLLLACVTV
ncbi:hypothetical protein DQ04_11991000 [Trypanosoma grayi]|uniref:hypothetical protein n=1 Tax=Trypanosoma grayi TaxID=71804 RepID=UPI0004F41843|nr:hypothetical protein DQ04_11991000 [Trypanosoma grayi]KEG06836.1 hypothetical protein DQ04_11991000 [Trypanosoma grayi]